MDRDNRWDRVELAYKALTEGEGVKGTDAAAAVQASYDADKTDEFVLPTVIPQSTASEYIWRIPCSSRYDTGSYR